MTPRAFCAGNSTANEARVCYERLALLSYLRLIFSRRYRVPRDKSQRPNRAARQASAAASATLTECINTIADLPGLSDLSRTKIVPAGFYRAVKSMWSAYDQYAQSLHESMGLGGLHPAGQGEGCNGCYGAPMGVSPAESLTIAQALAQRSDFAQLAQGLQDRAKILLEDIQAEQKKPDAQRTDPYALQKGRHRYHARGLACPFLDEKNKKCTIREHRPMSCRMHYIADPTERVRGDHPEHNQAKVVNLRLPTKTQVAINQHIDKRMGEISPLLFAGVLQAFELGQGQPVREVGQARQKTGRDGRLVARANRNVKGSKKEQKKRQKQKRRDVRR